MEYMHILLPDFVHDVNKKYIHVFDWYYAFVRTSRIFFLLLSFFLSCFIIEFLSHSEELMCTVHSFASGGFYSGKSHPSPRMYVSRGVRASAHARLFLESHLGVKMKNNIATEDVPGRGGWNFLFSSPRRVSFIQKENIRNCLCRLWLSVNVLLWCCFFYLFGVVFAFVAMIFKCH